MTSRTTRQTVTFHRPFKLAGMEREVPAGSYALETDEELLEGLSFPAYRRTASYLTLPGRAAGMISWEMVRIDPRELEALVNAGGQTAPSLSTVDRSLASRRAALRKANPG